MMKYEPECLHDFLIEHRHEIDVVSLSYYWESNYAVIETENYFFTDELEEYPVYAKFSYSYFDEEYSFFGNIDDAIEYTRLYDQWDCCEVDVTDGILTAKTEGYNPDGDDWPDGFDDLPKGAFDVEFVSFVYYLYRKQHYCSQEVFRHEEHPSIEDYGEYNRNDVFSRWIDFLNSSDRS